MKRISLHLRIFLLLLWILFHCGDGYHCPYGQHCNVFEPAPPGRAPPCAKPGLTYCVDPEPYPADVIRQLIEAGRYDVHKLLSDESREDFNANRKPEYPYGYGPNSLPHVDQISLVNQPYDYNNNNDIHNRYNHDIFHQKTPLQPPSPADPVPYDINTYQQTNYTKFGYNYQTPQSNYWNTHNQFGNNYDKKIFRQNNLPPNVAVYNQHFFDQEFDPNYEWAPTRFKQSTNEVTHYNPSEWWKYVVSPSQSDVSIQRSVTFPTRTTTARRSVRGKRNAELLDAAAQRTLSGGEALRIALGLSSAGTQAAGAGGAGGARRTRQAPDTEQLCPARTDFIQPRAALNNKGSWRYVVNMPDAMTQLVRVELCRSSVCNGICSLPSGYTSKCEQKYIQKRLMALGQTGDNLYTDVFWFPSCCQCTITQDGVL